MVFKYDMVKTCSYFSTIVLVQRNVKFLLTHTVYESGYDQCIVEELFSRDGIRSSEGAPQESKELISRSGDVSVVEGPGKVSRENDS